MAAVHAVGYRFRSELRTRWRAWLALALLIGVAAGIVCALAAGSLRTRSAQDRFLAEQRAYDVAVGTYCGGEGEPTEDKPLPGECHPQLAALPAVADATTVTEFAGLITLPDGSFAHTDQNDTCYSGPGAISIANDASGRFGTTINEYRIVAGRAPNPNAIDEVMISYETARRLGLRPGSELRVRLFGEASCTDDPKTWGPAQTVHVTGVQLSPGEVQSPNGFYLQTLAVTPAFVRAAGAWAEPRGENLVVRLRPGQSVDDLMAQAEEIGYHIAVGIDLAQHTEDLAHAIRPVYVSFALLALMTALAACLVLAQVLFRQAGLESDDDELLAALGFDARALIGLAALRATFVGVAAAVIAAGLAVATSAFFPTGVAGRMEPHRGVDVDVSTIALGIVAIVVFVIAVTVFAARLVVRRREHAAPATRASLAAAAARSGLSPAAVSGFDLAFTRSKGAAAVPIASTLTGLVIAVAALVGAATFGSSLSYLRANPELVGWNWDVLTGYPEDESRYELPPEEQVRVREQQRARLRETFARDPNIVAATTIGIWASFPPVFDVDGRRVDPEGFSAYEPGTAITPSVISGRAPRTPDEILVGPETLDELELGVGDRVDVVGRGGEWEEPGPEKIVRMDIVGTGAIFSGSRLGTGIAMTLDGYRNFDADATEDGWVVRTREGVDPRAVAESVRVAFPDVPPGSGFVMTYADFPNRTARLDEVERMPWLFVALMGGLAAAVLVHGLTSTVRARRRDLAVLRALGFSRGQTFRAVGWQANLHALCALAIGVPLGVFMGRALWNYYATNFGAVRHPVTPWLTGLVILFATLLLVAVIASPTAWRAARRRAAVVLRDE